MSGTIFIKGGITVGNGLNRHSNVLLEGGRIVSVTSDTAAPQGAVVVDAAGCLVSAGFVDLHVHFREPGYPEKETIRSGSLAAAAGGYTAVCAMPNLNPVPDSPQTLALEKEIIGRDALIDVFPYCSITKGRKGLELVDMAALKAGCIAFSDDGSGVQSREMMFQAMTLAAGQGCIIAAHCEDNALLDGGYVHDGRWCREHSHKGISSESEWRQVERDLELCAKTGCRYHVCHISTAESVELIRDAKKSGVRVSCETAPHYLTLCEDDMQEDGRFKMNPPLRSSRDREALLEGLADGTIDVVATDHAPHTAEQKSRGLRGSAMGIVGLETAFPVLYTRLVQTRIITLDRLVELMASAPRRLFNIKGGLKAGEPADITIVRLDDRYTIDSTRFLSKGRSTPFDGMEVFGRVEMTLKDGNIVWKRDSLQ